MDPYCVLLMQWQNKYNKQYKIYCYGLTFNLLRGLTLLSASSNTLLSSKSDNDIKLTNSVNSRETSSLEIGI